MLLHRLLCRGEGFIGSRFQSSQECEDDHDNNDSLSRDKETAVLKKVIAEIQRNENSFQLIKAQSRGLKSGILISNDRNRINHYRQHHRHMQINKSIITTAAAAASAAKGSHSHTPNHKCSTTTSTSGLTSLHPRRRREKRRKRHHYHQND